MKFCNIKKYLIVFILTLALSFQYCISPSFASLNSNSDSSIPSSYDPINDIPDENLEPENLDPENIDPENLEAENSDPIQEDNPDIDSSSDINTKLEDTNVDPQVEEISIDTDGIDSNLLKAIKDALGSDELTTESLNNLTTLDASSYNITNLDGIEYLSNLKSLNLNKNNISDIKLIANNLNELESLSIDENCVTDLSCLSSLSNLDDISICNQKISLDKEVDKNSNLVIKIGDDIAMPIDIDSNECSFESIVATNNDGNKIDIENNSFTFNDITEDSSYKISFNCSDNFQVIYFINVKVLNDNNDDSNTTNNNININQDNNFTHIDSSNNNVQFITDNSIIVQNVKVVTKFKNFINNKTPLAKYSTVKINASDKNLHVGDIFNPMEGVTASDSDGSDITKYILISKNTVITNENNIVTTPGNYEVIYEVKDTSGSVTSKSIKVNVYNYGEQLPIENVKTGDNSIIIALSLVGIVAILALVFINRKSKKNK